MADVLQEPKSGTKKPGAKLPGSISEASLLLIGALPTIMAMLEDMAAALESLDCSTRALARLSYIKARQDCELTPDQVEEIDKLLDDSDEEEDEPADND